jgi:2-keto-4-pentenoate hydratase/2-oxohepta-3-ene-1,7-dioic acid hydratase in catechol pathway
MNKIRMEGKEVSPSKVVCVGRNYAAHIEELHHSPPEEPVIFVKPNSAISNEVRFQPSDVVHYEAEIALLVRGGKFAGVGLGLDLTKRELQTYLKQNGLPWERAKAFDGAAVFSDFVSLDVELSQLALELTVNGEVKQEGGYGLMLFKPEMLLEEITSFMTLEDNDLLMTGTPKGVGPISPGDKLEGRILGKGEELVKAVWVVV